MIVDQKSGTIDDVIVKFGDKQISINYSKFVSEVVGMRPREFAEQKAQLIEATSDEARIKILSPFMPKIIDNLAKKYPESGIGEAKATATAIDAMKEEAGIKPAH